ncbi:MAG: helix-turn-helix domain-containing protein [Gammaproteobacteria bacterium]
MARAVGTEHGAAFWNKVTTETFAQPDSQPRDAFRFRPRDAFRFDGTLRRERAGPLTIVGLVCGAVRIQHTRAHIAGILAPSYLLLAPIQREFELTLQGGPGITVHAGEFFLIDHARPYELVHGEGVRTFCIDVPRQSLDERMTGAEGLAGRLMRPESAMSRMLIGLLRNLSDEVSPSGIAGLSPAFGQTLLGFVSATCSEVTPAPLGRGVTARAKAYRSYIDSRLSESELKPADVASHFEVSERYVRSVLRADGESFSVYLLRRRLSRCASLLVDPDWGHATIMEIAFSAGFSNATHFAQAFRTHYGVAPREYCKQRGQALCPR